MRDKFDGIRILKYPTKVCPFCGENKSAWDYLGTVWALKKGIDARIRVVKCYTCGAMWEIEKGYTEHR